MYLSKQHNGAGSENCALLLVFHIPALLYSAACLRLQHWSGGGENPVAVRWLTGRKTKARRGR